jgi:DNA repair protein RecO (recombination protein O)
MSPASHRVSGARGFLLHQRPYRESSLIVEIYTRDHGRLSAFARAARGPRSRFPGMQPFRPMLFSWSGRGEAPALTAAEPDGPAPPALAGERLLSAFYLNELLLRLTVAHDPHPDLYREYRATLGQLCDGAPLEAALRRFEQRLLVLIGYGLELARDVDERPLAPDAYYHFEAGTGLRPGDDAPGAIPGRVLLALAADQPLGDPAAQRQARAVLRAAIDHCLDGRELRVRAVARAVANMERS